MTITEFMQGRPLPEEDAVCAPFFAAAAKGELHLQRCRDTGQFQWYPRACSVYTGGDVEWVKVSGKARIHTYTVIHQNHAQPFKALLPYVVAVVEFDDAPGARMMANVTDVDPTTVKIGMEVDVYFLQAAEADESRGEGDLFLPFFRPVS